MSNHLTVKTARRPLLIWLVIAVAIFWLAASQVTRHGMEPWEHSVFNGIYNLPLNLKPFFVIITQAGSALMIVVVASLLVMKRHRLQAARIILLSAVTFVVVWLTKHYFQRPRPNVLLSTVTQRGPHEGDYGFPSAHAAIAMAVGIALLPIIPRRWWWLIFTLILLVGISRIYLGVHAPLDIIAGFAVGAICSLTYLLLLGGRSNKKSVKNKTI